jgi:hypothetical protein
MNNLNISSSANNILSNVFLLTKIVSEKIIIYQTCYDIVYEHFLHHIFEINFTCGTRRGAASNFKIMKILPRLGLSWFVVPIFQSESSKSFYYWE